MLHLSSWMTTLPIMLIGMLGIILVIGVIVLAVMLLNRLTTRNKPFVKPAFLCYAYGKPAGEPPPSSALKKADRRSLCRLKC